ncbi:MAG TPA: hypothetical protein VKB73_16590 [Gaiellaceae bacterium]|nr:hypothetical protein [Gaiellaceae bacterium]
MWEIWTVWALCALATIAVFETYWRIPPSELWKVHNSGFVGGIGRAFVFVSFSPAIAALAVLPIVADRLEQRAAHVLAVVAFALCATVAVPGVQTPGHLDPKWSNTWAVVGVGLAVGLTVWATRRGRPEPRRTSRAGDRLRLVLEAVILFWATPYIAAELGFHLDGVPFFGWFFQTGKPAPEPGGYVHATVHYGHHHGLDGFLLATTALLLSRLLGGIRTPGLRTFTAALLSLMLVYGLTNMVNDLWAEQVVKRGWTSWEVPDVLQPKASLAWAAMLVAAALVYAAFFARKPLLGRR